MGTTTERDFSPEVLDEIKKRQTKAQKKETAARALEGAVEAFKAPKLALILGVALAAHLAQINLGELAGAFLVVHGANLLSFRRSVSGG